MYAECHVLSRLHISIRRAPFDPIVFGRSQIASEVSKDVSAGPTVFTDISLRLVDGDMALENILYGMQYAGITSAMPHKYAQPVHITANIRSVTFRRSGAYSCFMFIWSRLDGTHQRVLNSLRRRQRFQASGSVVGFIDQPVINSSFQIIDSIMALFRADYSGRGELSERQQKVRVCIGVRRFHDPNPVILARSGEFQSLWVPTQRTHALADAF